MAYEGAYFRVTGDGWSPHIECAVCLDPWCDPVELRPCEHVYCRACVARCFQCPRCRKEIDGRAAPSPILVRIAGRVPVTCGACAWKGTRAEQAAHAASHAPRDPFRSAATGAAQSNTGGAAAAAVSTASEPAAVTASPVSALDGVTRHSQNDAPQPQLAAAAGQRLAAQQQQQQRPAAIVRHARPSEPWRTYNLTPTAYGKAVAAFKKNATGSGSVIDSASAFRAFLLDSELSRGLITDASASILFGAADTTHCGGVCEHDAITFAALNRDPPRRRRRVTGHGSDEATDVDGDSAEEEASLSSPLPRVAAAEVPPPPAFGGLPSVGGLGIGRGLPQVDAALVPGIGDLDPHITGRY